MVPPGALGTAELRDGAGRGTCREGSDLLQVLLTSSTLLLAFAGASISTALADVAALARQQQGAISAVLNDKDRAALTQTAAASPTAEAAEGYGHALLMRRHLAPAAWMYAAAVERDPALGSAITPARLPMQMRVLRYMGPFSRSETGPDLQLSH